MNTPPLAGKVGLVTGVSRGIVGYLGTCLDPMMLVPAATSG